MIEKYYIGFACEGEYMGRVIVPSYDMEDELNYFVSRAWFKTKNKYKNPEAPKELIIFNEKLIDWTKPIYICEGVFDGFFTPNPVILLGKVLHDLLFEKIYNNAQSDVIICLDEDAWNNAKKLYNTLNGGKLRGRVKIIKLPKDKDVAELRGNIEDYFYQMNY
jgi:DNA primase